MQTLNTRIIKNPKDLSLLKDKLQQAMQGKRIILASYSGGGVSTLKIPLDMREFQCNMAP